VSILIEFKNQYIPIITKRNEDKIDIGREMDETARKDTGQTVL
jgi:hypothetical protein